MSRRHYEIDRPWKRAGLPRNQFEKVLLKIPIEKIKGIQLEAVAEKLLRSAFGKAALFA